MINKVILVGNLGKEPEVKHFEGGGAVAKFSIATNEKFKNKAGEMQEQTEWHNVVVWNALAGVAEKYLKRGARVYIEGKLTHRKYQDASGADKYITEVVGRTLKMLDRREGGGSNNMPTAKDAPATVKEPVAVKEPAANNNATADSSTAEAGGDLPF